MNDPDYIHPPAIVSRIVEETNESGFAMASEPRTGALLRALAASKPNGRFLELGTGTGIATAWLLAGMDADSKLISVDIDARFQGLAHRFLGSDPRLTLVLEDGTPFLRRQLPDTYDFVFADAMPGKYEGLEDCLRVVKPGGLYVIDDMLPQENWPEGHAAKIPPLLKTLANDPHLTIVPMTWASGIVVAVKRAE